MKVTQEIFSIFIFVLCLQYRATGWQILIIRQPVPKRIAYLNIVGNCATMPSVSMCAI
jgi:hypothetical protein